MVVKIKGAATSSSVVGGNGTPSTIHLKTGVEAKAALDKDDARAEAAEAEYGKLWRFGIPKGNLDEDFKITFLDGTVTEDGVLDGPMFYEHFLYGPQGWRPYTCIKAIGEEPCPLCEGGDTPALVQALTVIDHTHYQADDGTVYKDRKKLFVAKRKTIKMLYKYAEKKSGLGGCTFEVSRTGPKEPRVGNVYEFIEKNDIEALAKVYGHDETKPAVYADEITVYSASEMKKMGLGPATVTVGQKNAPASDVGAEL